MCLRLELFLNRQRLRPLQSLLSDVLFTVSPPPPRCCRRLCGEECSTPLGDTRPASQTGTLPSGTSFGPSESTKKTLGL